MFLFVNFNSIKVQLEHDMQRYYTDFMLFQFHKGTIRTLYQLIPQLLNINFNSIKVQLERSYATWIRSSSTFQFHKGTIRTATDFPIPELDSIFQFHKGTIRTR